MLELSGKKILFVWFFFFRNLGASLTSFLLRCLGVSILRVMETQLVTFCPLLLTVPPLSVVSSASSGNVQTIQLLCELKSAVNLRDVVRNPVSSSTPSRLVPALLRGCGNAALSPQTCGLRRCHFLKHFFFFFKPV